MRLLLYNIRYGAGVGHRFHLPLPYMGYFKPTNGHFKQIVEFIQSVNPDILGLVEVDFGSFRVANQNQADHIAAILNHSAVYQSKYPVSSMAQKLPILSKQGNAVLTNQDVVRSRFHYLRHGVKRLVIEVELQDLSIFLVHLSLKFRHRQYQLHDLHELIADRDKPVIVAGDFNSLWGDDELQLFLAATGLKSANVDGLFSYPSRFPRFQLDYVFHSPQIVPTRFEVPRVVLSDHAPLILEFDVRQPHPSMFNAGPSFGAGLSQRAGRAA
jgi:endonuclease/exonuclease/phosphatase family metal-dependent hydrolase